MEAIVKSDFKNERDYFLKIAEELEENKPFPPMQENIFLV